MHNNNTIESEKKKIGTQTRTKSFHVQNFANCVLSLVQLIKPWSTGISMVLILDGNSEYVAHAENR